MQATALPTESQPLPNWFGHPYRLCNRHSRPHVVSCCVYNMRKPHARQLSIQICLLGQSSCSSPSTKEVHAAIPASFGCFSPPPRPLPLPSKRLLCGQKCTRAYYYFLSSFNPSCNNRPNLCKWQRTNVVEP